MAVKLGERYSEYKSINQDFRKDCNMFLLLFILHMNNMIIK